MKNKLLANLLLSLCFFLAAVSGAQTIPTASFSISSGTICSKSSVQITDMSTDVPTSWSYSVNGVPTSSTQSPEITFTTAGTYSIDLEATNAAGTSPVFTETLSVSPLPTITISGSTMVCTAATSTLNASGADTFTWSMGPNASMITINPATNTNYTVVGTSTLTGCSDSSFVSVFTVPLPTISVSDATICAGTFYTISPSGASTYSYSGGSSVISPTMNGTYTVSGTDALTGCSDSVAVSISVNVVSLTANSGSICSGQNFTITPTGATTYTYSGGSNIVSPLVNTSYTVSATDAITGCSDSIAVLVAVIASPTITINTSTICAGFVFTIVPTGATNYTFSSGSNTVAPVTSTNYLVSGTDPLTGCVGSKIFSLSVNPLPVITVNSGSICAGDIFTLMPVGASTYTFSNGSATVMPLTTTNYTITGTSGQGCFSQVPAIVTVVVSGTKPTVFISSLTPTTLCTGETIVINVFGATNYSWNTGATTSTILVTPTISTLYSVTGTDLSTGCSATASIFENVSDCTGMENVPASIQYKLYPNPTNGELNIETDDKITMSVINALGEIVLKQQLNEGKNILNLNEQPNGVYFVNLQQNNETKTIRLIKH